MFKNAKFGRKLCTFRGFGDAGGTFVGPSEESDMKPTRRRFLQGAGVAAAEDWTRLQEDPGRTRGEPPTSASSARIMSDYVMHQQEPGCRGERLAQRHEHVPGDEQQVQLWGPGG